MLTVSELNRLAREVLEMSFPLFWVSGEVSNFTRAASGHWYFSLKDQTAQVKCVMFKGRNSYVNFIPREGDKIEARCTATLYEARGDFQLTVEFIQKAGLGALFEAFEKLKNKLAMEGLFDAASKHTIPKHPNTIGIVTSPDAAALRDVLTTLKRRNPGVNVIIYPTPVQGKGAAETIAKAINTANQRAEVDTLIICRGGGSMEDLWQFNEEIVARAISDCTIPTISGIGHETDFTICDFVADMRAATPTAAAELACMDVSSLKNQLASLHNKLTRQIEFSINQLAQKLDFLARRLVSPLQQLENKANQLKQLQNRFALAMQQQLQAHQQHLLRLKNSVEQLNPQAVLARGYALVQTEKGEVVRSTSQIKLTDMVQIRFAEGQAGAEIKLIEK
ncbi:MAG TPA: exodeoxyribonuclease VII large subunit [Methylotenera sp.]|nr:exodeoxyribonuclease VII large subunit [Methylotenera sp.]HPV44157.1 exodeoxyribonuclease VII large subunit [Methylotenera sp.]